METESYVYFAIKTENKSIEEEMISNYLGITPTKFNKIHSKGIIPKCTTWQLGTPKNESPNIDEKIARVITILFTLKDKLILLRKKYPEFEYVFEIVIYHGYSSGGFSLENDQLMLLGSIGAYIDVDQYNLFEK